MQLWLRNLTLLSFTKLYYFQDPKKKIFFSSAHHIAICSNQSNLINITLPVHVLTTTMRPASYYEGLFVPHCVSPGLAGAAIAVVGKTLGEPGDVFFICRV